MKVIAAYEAKSRFSEPLREGAAGEIFIITQTGQKKWLNFVHANLKS
jgi:antitoxin (DNA-binding transcriptional repressor) of toxin-antitoxin stability system